MMDRSLRYGRERFAQALRLLEGRDLKALRGFPNTASNRLRTAVLAVYACVPNHFPSSADYREFTDLMFELRVHDRDGRVLRAIEGMDERECVQFGRRLYELARRVAAKSLPSERFARAHVETAESLGGRRRRG